MIIIEVSTKKYNKPLRDVEVDYEIDNNKCEVCIDKLCLKVCPVEAVFIDSENNIKINEKCFGCVLCREACPYDAIKMRTEMAEPIRENIPNINSKLCRACGACVSACKSGAIHLSSSGSEEIHSEIDEDKCVRCGYCFRNCPTDAIKYGEILPRTVSAGRAIVINQKNCIGCMTCTRICPSKGAMNVGRANKFPYIDPSYCARCEECMDVCPSTAIKYSSRKRSYKQFNKLKSLEITSNIIDKDINGLAKDTSKIDNILSGLFNKLTSENKGNDFEINVTNSIIKEIEYITPFDISVDYIKDLVDHFPLMRKIKVHEDTCIGCGVCIDSCPVNCIWLESPSPIHIGDNCVFCGKCVSICPVTAIELQETFFETRTIDLEDGRNRNVKKDNIFFIRKNVKGPRKGKFNIQKDLCQSCGICVNQCPVDTLNLKKDEIIVDNDSCIFCRECEVLCPVNAIKICSK